MHGRVNSWTGCFTYSRGEKRIPSDRHLQRIKCKPRGC